MRQPPRQRRQCHQHQGQQLLEQLWGPGDSTGCCFVPVALSSRFHPAGCAGATSGSSPDCTVDPAGHSSCGGTLLFWDASTAAAPVTAASEPLACLQEAQGRSNKARWSLRRGALTYSIPVGTSSAINFPTVLQQYLLQWQQRRIRASSSTVMRHVLVVEEERAGFFLPERIPQSLCLCSLNASPEQQKQRPPSQNVPRCDFPVSRDPNSNSTHEFSAIIKGVQVTNAAKVAAAAGARVPDGCLVLSFLWAVASWFSWLADPLPTSYAAAAADLGLCSTASERAAVLATTDPDAATAASGLAGAIPAVQQSTRAAASIMTAAAALRGGFCLRLAALRTLAYWCCCCVLAKQEATYNVQRNRVRQQQRPQMVVHAAASRLISTDMKQQNNSTSSSITLLRQLQQECRESFGQLLQQQQDAQQQLAERQGIEMESACAMREKQEQELKAAIAPCCLPIQDSGGAKNPTAVVAAAALEACERDLQELVQQHLSECELLERHWIHEQQLLREQQLHMFKNVAADLYLLQHGSAALYGAACQELVLPPLPSAGENERWAFNCKQQEQDQRRHEQLLQNQHPQPTWRQVGVAARQLFGRSSGSLSQEGDSPHHAHSYAICSSVASGASIVADEERLLSSGAAAAHSGSTGAAATAISASMDAAAAAGQHILQQQDQQAAYSPCKEDNSSQGGSTQIQQRVQQKHQQQQNQRVLHGSSADFTANAAHSQRQKQHQRQLAVAAAAHQGPVFDMPRLLQGIAIGAVQPQQHRSSRVPPQHQQPRQLGGVQEHAELRFIFGVQQRRTIWLHVCTGLTVDFFPSTTASLPDRQNQRQVSASASYAAKWLTLLGRGPTPLPEEPLADWAAGSLSYCYKDVRHMRGAIFSCSMGSSGRLSCGESPSWLETDDSHADIFASLRSGPTESLSGAVLPTGAAMQESCACIKTGKETPDLLLPSLEEQRRLLGAAINANRSSSACICSKQRLLLQQGEVFVSRHAARLRPQICFHLAVASTGTRHEASQTPSPPTAHKLAEVSVEDDGNRRTSSAGDDLDSLCAPVCEGLRQILRLCEKHAVGALLLPALLLETEASATCLPFAVLQRRMLSVLRCVVAELRAIALSPAGSSCCPSDASVGRLKHLVLLLPPIQQQQQEGSDQMNHLVQAAVNFLRNSACCC